MRFSTETIETRTKTTTYQQNAMTSGAETLHQQNMNRTDYFNVKRNNIKRIHVNTMHSQNSRYQ